MNSIQHITIHHSEDGATSAVVSFTNGEVYQAEVVQAPVDDLGDLGSAVPVMYEVVSPWMLLRRTAPLEAQPEPS